MSSDEKRKPLGRKQRIREEKKKEARRGIVIVVAILIAIVLASGFIINSMLNQPSTPTTQPVSSTSELRAAIVDHLSLTFPNQTFVETATNILQQAGYTVDYYPGEEVTVEFYRNLPTHGYGIVILRVHSSATEAQTGTEGPAILFTSERIDTNKYVYEQLTARLMGVAYSVEDREKGITYFGISPSFVTGSMNGRFQNTTIIMMGCEGLDNPLMAQAFVEKGAKVYISWNKSVLAFHTDQATTHLLQHLVTEKHTIKEAVEETMKEVGPDPANDSVLQYYPPHTQNYAIDNL